MAKKRKSRKTPARPPKKPQATNEAPLLLRELSVTNWRCLANATVSFMSPKGPRQHSVIVGKNGSGKTSLLRALAIGLCQQKEASALMGELAGDSVRRNKRGNYANHAEIFLRLVDPADEKVEYWTRTRIDRDASGQETLTKTVEPKTFPWRRVFAGGYGVNRGARHHEARSGYSRSSALKSLFSDDTSLLDPEATLRAIKLADHERPTAGLLAATKGHLRTLLQLNPNHDIDVSAEAVLVHGPWGTMPFHALGDGYRGTAAWVLDLLGMALSNGKLEDAMKVRGVVLIDEIDEHLHPSWQRHLLRLLRNRFSELQIVGTTHSPMTIVDCDKSDLIACKLYNAVASVYQDFDDPRGRSADEILRGEWFGLASTLDTTSENLLRKYQRKVEANAPESEIATLREKIRKRLGRRFDSPIDELAIRIAATVRDDHRAAATPRERHAIISRAAAELRKKLKASN